MVTELLTTARMKEKRIAVDVDGCICAYDFPKIVWDIFRARIDATKIFAYNLADVLGVSSKKIDKMFYDQVWGKPQFNEGAIEVLSEWKSKYEIVIFSNRTKYMGYNGLIKWLLNWDIPFSYLGGMGSFWVHIDDRPSKLCDSDSQIKLLFTQPWNSGCWNIEDKLIRVSSWQEIKKLVG